jgi:hypothetical protein
LTGAPQAIRTYRIAPFRLAATARAPRFVGRDMNEYRGYQGIPHRDDCTELLDLGSKAKLSRGPKGYARLAMRP